MSQNKIIPFNYGDNLIRVVNDETTGEPLWIAKDVCKVLEIENHRQALSRLDDDEKGVISNDTLGGNQKMSAINEAGLYNLIFSSKKPEAKPFKRWVTHEVLPSIRKTGGYGMSQNTDLAPLMQLVSALAEAVQSMMIMMREQHALIKEQNEKLNHISHTQETYILIRQENRASTITAKQTDELVALIEKAAIPFAKYHRLDVASAQRFLFGKLNERMAVKKYYHIKAVDFNKAMKYINELKNAAEASTNPTYKKILETDFDELGWGEEVEASEDRELYE